MSTKIIAHRGASAIAPENTIPAVELAWQQNADAVEVDVMLTSDNQIVVFHDEDTFRLTGRPGKIAEKSWAELGNYRVKVNGQEARIPLLEEVMAVVPADKILVVEIKCGPQILKPLQTLMQKVKMPPENLQFISLVEDSMQVVAEAFPEYESQRVFEFDEQPPDVDMLLNYAAQTQFNGIDVELGDYITDDFVKRVHSLNKKMYVWTVNDFEVGAKLARIGVDGLTTDHPAQMRKAIGK